MVSVEQKNEMFAIYSKVFGRNKSGLQEYALKINVVDIQPFVLEFNEIQKKVFDYFWNLTEDGTRFLSKEIEQLAKAFINENYQWIDEKAFKSFMNYYLHYICWHEGIAKN